VCGELDTCLLAIATAAAMVHADASGSSGMAPRVARSAAEQAAAEEEEAARPRRVITLMPSVFDVPGSAQPRPHEPSEAGIAAAARVYGGGGIAFAPLPAVEAWELEDGARASLT
jgi:hypothetical protein